MFLALCTVHRHTTHSAWWGWKCGSCSDYGKSMRKNSYYKMCMQRTHIFFSHGMEYIKVTDIHRTRVKNAFMRCRAVCFLSCFHFHLIILPIHRSPLTHCSHEFTLNRIGGGSGGIYCYAWNVTWRGIHYSENTRIRCIIRWLVYLLCIHYQTTDNHTYTPNFSLTLFLLLLACLNNTGEKRAVYWTNQAIMSCFFFVTKKI